MNYIDIPLYKRTYSKGDNYNSWKILRTKFNIEIIEEFYDLTPIIKGSIDNFLNLPWIIILIKT